MQLEIFLVLDIMCQAVEKANLFLQYQLSYFQILKNSLFYDVEERMYQ